MMENLKADINHLDTLLENYCTEEWRNLIEESKTSTTYPKGVKIFKEGEEAKRVKIIEQGKVKVYTTYDKNERIIRLAGDGQVLGHRGFGDDFTYSVTAETLSESEIIHIPIKLFQSVLKANNEFCYYMMMFFAEELRRSEQQMKDLTNMAVHQRVTKALCMNYKAFGFAPDDEGLLDFTLSRKDIAKMASTTYESVIRVLSDLDKRKLISIEGKSIRINDIDKIQNEIKFNKVD